MFSSDYAALTATGKAIRNFHQKGPRGYGVHTESTLAHVRVLLDY